MSEGDTRGSGATKPKLWVRLFALAAVLFTAWHLFASFLWIAPYSANAREAVPGNALSNYMLPMFGQSWSVFAPEPINGDYHFEVRARLDDGTETEWVSATDVELSMIRYNLTPPRAGIQSSELASSYKSAYDGLQNMQQTVLGGDFEVEEWQVGLRAALETQAAPAPATVPEVAPAPAPELADADPLPEINTAQIEKMLGEEHRAAAYATQVAGAIWGDGVVLVQYRVSRQNIVPFAQRHDPNAERPAPTVVQPGWRNPVVVEGQNDENFARVFGEQFERISR